MYFLLLPVRPTTPRRDRGCRPFAPSTRPFAAAEARAAPQAGAEAIAALDSRREARACGRRVRRAARRSRRRAEAGPDVQLLDAVCTATPSAPRGAGGY